MFAVFSRFLIVKEERTWYSNLSIPCIDGNYKYKPFSLVIILPVLCRKDRKNMTRNDYLSLYSDFLDRFFVKNHKK